MKTFGAVFALACLAHSALCAVAPKECGGAPTLSCDAVSVLLINTFRGSCKSTAKADCKVWSESQSAFEQAFKDWWSGGDEVCDNDKTEVVATAIATAAAKIWLSAAVDVECLGKFQGFSCGWDFANARDFANAMQEAVVTAAAEASLALKESGDAGSDVADTFCFSDLRRIDHLLIEAANDAIANACTARGRDPLATFESSFVSYVQHQIAIELSMASNCVGGGSSPCQGDFCLDRVGIPSCSGSGASQCCQQGMMGSTVCDPTPPRLRRFRRRPCPRCPAPWTRAPDKHLVWRQGNGELCYCENVSKSVIY